MRRKKGQLCKTLRDGCTFIAFVVLGLLIAAKLEIGNTRKFDGSFTVIDGDTLRHGDERLRLDGIDAPEIAQTCARGGKAWPCGQQSRITLRQFASAEGFSCKGSDRDRYQRLLVTCGASGMDAGASMVEAGLAIAVNDMYHAQENIARQRALGLWAGEFDMPRDWRRAHEANAEADSGQGMFTTVLEFIGWLR